MVAQLLARGPRPFDGTRIRRRRAARRPSHDKRRPCERGKWLSQQSLLRATTVLPAGGWREHSHGCREHLVSKDTTSRYAATATRETRWVWKKNPGPILARRQTGSSRSDLQLRQFHASRTETRILSDAQLKFVRGRRTINDAHMHHPDKGVSTEKVILMLRLDQ
jgi:hypothetical protein